MFKFREFLKKNIVYIIFLSIGIVAIGFVKGINVVVMLTLFLSLFASYSYTIVAFYNLFRGLKERGIILLCLFSTVLTVVIYYLYDIYFLFKIISLASVISILMVVLAITRTKNK